MNETLIVHGLIVKAKTNLEYEITKNNSTMKEKDMVLPKHGDGLSNFYVYWKDRV